ncbi:hypothetical protein CEXT_363611 [Caerostris extrusa]|uniref:Peptidase aspartic putative domain-containing protein n=1 Tax=Caerostris extrusa TaxID=172846 RepID=A0AAV4XIG1_CAEEX|nr:hypothetical protein CEXT_363611 [Caerostris extrusa]
MQRNFVLLNLHVDFVILNISLLHDERLRSNCAQITKLAVDDRQYSLKDVSLIQTNVDQQTAFNSKLSSPIRCETTVKVNQENMALLPTAMALIKDDSGKYIKIRILLDSGSQACFLSESFAKRHSLNYDSSDRISVTGISTTTTLASQPSHTITAEDLNLLNGLQLADGNCFQSSKVDLIIGADTLFSIILPGQILRANDEPIAQNTCLGWVVAGNIKNSQITHLT